MESALPHGRTNHGRAGGRGTSGMAAIHWWERDPFGYSTRLAHLAGGWSEAEFEEFNKHTASFRELDPELWK